MQSALLAVFRLTDLVTRARAAVVCKVRYTQYNCAVLSLAGHI